MTQDYTFFWNGPFSNWHLADIVIRGHTFNCCEQYFMTAKAAMFGASDIARAIINAPDPRTQKGLGRTIPNFDPIAWDAASRDIMFRANWAKYTQNTGLRKLLLSTMWDLVEASPYDKVWGIGLPEDDPRAKDKSQWLGQNWLGEILTEIRDYI